MRGSTCTLPTATTTLACEVRPGWDVQQWQRMQLQVCELSQATNGCQVHPVVLMLSFQVADPQAAQVWRLARQPWHTVHALVPRAPQHAQAGQGGQSVAGQRGLHIAIHQYEAGQPPAWRQQGIQQLRQQAAICHAPKLQLRISAAGLCSKRAVSEAAPGQPLHLHGGYSSIRSVSQPLPTLRPQLRKSGSTHSNMPGQHSQVPHIAVL